jgi:6-phosphogluconolactonase
MKPMEVYKPVLTTFESNDKLYESATTIAINQILDIIGEKGTARIALSGGGTPLPLYKKLFSNPFIEPELIELFQTDERYVPASSTDSNQYNILQSLGENKGYFKELNLIDTSLPISESVDTYGEIIDNLDDVLFDLTILGIGEDGHFASLFPNGDYLNGDQPHVIHTRAKNTKIKDRISISINDILKSDMILVLLTGENKRHVVPEILEGKKVALDFPAKFLLCHPNVTILESFEEM